MQVIGTTRSGKDIYIDFLFDQAGQMQLVFPEFDQFEDNLDAFVVFDFVAVREFRRQRFVLESRMREGLTHFQAKVLAKKIDDPFVLNPAQRIALAKHLVRPEFQD